jgi:NAD(P)-dependent dehydrogenase (short-subunit alcohol dehydrogenase family)
MEVNATGHFLVAQAAMATMRAQGIGGSIIFIASKFVVSPGRDFGAYSSAKAAEAQLARIVAIEGGEHGIRANIVNPDAVFEGSGLFSEELRANRARAHGVEPAELEAFYQQRNLLKVRVLPEDVAEAALFFASDRSAKTTGAMLSIDGGVREAFVR